MGIRPDSAGVNRFDRLLAAEEEPSLGSHLITPRLGFAHHGIYVGQKKVVHYAGFLYWSRQHSVEEASLERFARGHSVFVRAHAAARFERQDVIRRARSRIGEDSYRLLRNNCEHFCEWCVDGEQRSYQVERLFTLQKLFTSLTWRLLRAIANQ